MSNRTLVAIVGMPGSGKSVAADFFRSEGVVVFRFGDQTDRGLEELGKKISEENERWYREKIRAELGMASMAIKIEPRIEEEFKRSTFVVLDGLYSWEEYIYLKNKFPFLQLLCIWAPSRLRYKRLGIRNVRPLTREEAQSRDVAEIENLNKGGPIAIADYLIKNDDSRDTFQEEFRKIYLSLQ